MSFLEIIEDFKLHYIRANEEKTISEDLLTVINRHIKELKDQNTLDPDKIRHGVRI